MKNLVLGITIVVTIIMYGCAMMPPEAPPVKAPVKPRVETPAYKVVFENSNAILIEKSVKGLEVVDKIRTAVSKTDKITVVSIERPHTVDIPINYLIEDQLIANLTTAGYNVLERDADMIPRFVSEGGTKYNIVDLSLYNRLVEGDNKVVIPNQPNIETQIESADIILSYRILECGILYNKASGGTITMGRQRSVERLARTRLNIRVTDAKTSEIKLSTILENEIKDSVPLNQIKTLENLHYKYYDQAMPNIYHDQVVPDINKEKSE